MKVIEAMGTVTEDGVLTVRVGADIPLGRHPVVVVVGGSLAGRTWGKGLDFLVDHCGPWPENLSLKREDIYGDAQR